MSQLPLLRLQMLSRKESDAIHDLLSAVLALLHVGQAFRNAGQATVPQLHGVGLDDARADEVRDLGEEVDHVRAILRRGRVVLAQGELSSKRCVDQRV